MTGWEKALPCLAAAAITLLVASPAAAQPSPADVVFLQGKALMDQGRTAEACEKFAESLALERRGGVLLNLAVCREKQGRHATALNLLYEARVQASKDGRPDRAALALEHIAVVRRKVSWIVVRVPAAADAPSLEVRCDQEPLPRESWGTLNAVDPGPHTVSSTAPGRPRFEVTVVVGPDGDTRTVEIPAATMGDPQRVPAATMGDPHRVPQTPPAEPPPAPPVDAFATGETPATNPPQRASRTPSRSHLRPQIPVGAAIVGVGGVIAIAGAAFGAKAIVDIRNSDPSCPNDGCTNVAAFRQNQDAHTEARLADVAIPTGLAVAGAGLYLLLRRPPPAADTRAGATTVRLAPAALLRGASLTVSAPW